MPILRNVLDKVNEVSQLFVKGSKKVTLFQEVVQQNPNYSRQQKFIFKVCIFLWVENLDEYNQFVLAYPYIVEALEVISNKLHLEKYPAGVTGTLSQEERLLHCLQVLQHLSFALFG